jgi:hypothetical protein
MDGMNARTVTSMTTLDPFFGINLYSSSPHSLAMYVVGGGGGGGGREPKGGEGKRVTNANLFTHTITLP